jgi:hypothetical protein
MKQEIERMMLINSCLIQQLTAKDMTEEQKGYVNAIHFNNMQLQRILEGRELHNLHLTVHRQLTNSPVS